MQALLLTILLVSSVWASPFLAAKNPGTRIIGGNSANAGEYPFAAAIYTTTPTSTFFCGGALLNNQWILTTATCVFRVQLFTIRIGTHDLNSNSADVIRVSTDKYVIHPNYNADTLDNDIGLIQLRLPITFTDYIKPIGLPARDVQSYAVVTAIGWGQTSDQTAGLVDVLQTVTLTTLSNEECTLAFGNQVTDNMVCVDGNYNQGTCRGDSGGPLIQYVNSVQPTVVGVASFISGNGCESTDPSGYTRVYPVIDWIKTTAGIP